MAVAKPPFENPGYGRSGLLHGKLGFWYQDLGLGITASDPLTGAHIGFQNPIVEHVG